MYAYAYRVDPVLKIKGDKYISYFSWKTHVVDTH